MTASYNAHRRKIDFGVNDYVWLGSRYYRTDRPSKKLDNPTTSKFKVLMQHGNSFKLQIPSSWKIHDVFPAEKLRKAYSDPLPGQIEAPPDPVNLTSVLNELSLSWVLGLTQTQLNFLRPNSNSTQTQLN